MTWQTVPFSTAIEDVSGGNRKVAQRDYLVSGPLPVVDQGQQLVGGYTTDEEVRCRAELPVLVFGDHTRIFKYIDFPFAMGADGVKVLKPSADWDPRFVFHYLRSLEIPSAGYSRHFKFLKEFAIPKPPVEEQRRISAILDQADALRAKRREALACLDDLAQSIFLDMFGDTTDGNSHYAPLPLAEWIDPARPITYGILKPGPDTDGGVPYVRVADMKEGGIAVSGVRRTTREIDAAYRRSRLQAGDLLMSIRGHVGRLAEIPAALDGANITQDSARLAIARGPAPFVRGALESPGLQRWMARRTKGAAVRGINLGDLRLAPIPDAPVDQQEAFAALTCELRLLQEKAKSQLKVSERLLAALQARAFSGQL